MAQAIGLDSDEYLVLGIISHFTKANGRGPTRKEIAMEMRKAEIRRDLEALIERGEIIKDENGRLRT